MFFHHMIQTVDFVDKKHVARLEIGQQSGQIGWALQNRSGGRAHFDTHLVGQNGSQGRLSQAGRAM